MDWAAVSAVVSGITLVGTVGVGGIMWGTMSEKVSGHTKRLDNNATEHERFDSRLTSHDVTLGRLQEWKDGYNAAVRTGGSSSKEIA
jgi:hypothetical protein